MFDKIKSKLQISRYLNLVTWNSELACRGLDKVKDLEFPKIKLPKEYSLSLRGTKMNFVKLPM